MAAIMMNQWVLGCPRPFMGPAVLLAARHRFRRAERLAEEDPEVLEATYQVAQALAGEGREEVQVRELRDGL